MRIIPALALITAAVCASPIWAGEIFGTWKANLFRSMAADTKSLVIRFEPHARREVFTLYRIDREGRSTSSSTILYLDGKERAFEGFGCSGTQLSRRLDGQAVEILRTCASGEWTRFVRRPSTHPGELDLEVIEQQPGRPRLERHLILEQQ